MYGLITVLKVHCAYGPDVLHGLADHRRLLHGRIRSLGEALVRNALAEGQRDQLNENGEREGPRLKELEQSQRDERD